MQERFRTQPRQQHKQEQKRQQQQQPQQTPHHQGKQKQGDGPGAQQHHQLAQKKSAVDLAAHKQVERWLKTQGLQTQEGGSSGSGDNACNHLLE